MGKKLTNVWGQREAYQSGTSRARGGTKFYDKRRKHAFNSVAMKQGTSL